ncbi:MAG: sensor histidine kinase [Oscillospiraceae bacterium]|nr:sensor histidine kinase [Oscillospiraceae bacterium]MBR0451076.1 sensor histidine kinase [Oscillospiraceae bacterium]
MKKFTRSIPGKTIIFILLIICCIICGSSILCELVYWDADMFYVTEDTFIEQHLYEMVRSREDDLIWNMPMDPELYTETGYINRYYGENRTNLLIQYDLITPQGVERIFSNTPSIDEIIYQSYYTGAWDEEGRFNREYIDPSSITSQNNESGQEIPAEYYHLTMGLRKDLLVDDEFRAVTQLIHYEYMLHRYAVPSAIISGIIAVILFVLLMSVSARHPDTDEIVPGILNWVPFDVMTVIIGAACFLIGLTVVETVENIPKVLGYTLIIFLCLMAIVVLLSLFIGWCMGLAARIKQQNLIRNTLCWKLCSLLYKLILIPVRWLFNFIRTIPFMWKALVLWVIYCIFEIILISEGSRSTILLFQGWTSLFLLYCIYAMFKVNRKAKSISNGYYEQSNDNSLLLGFRDMDRSLTQINSGLSIAVEQRMKSERMKTELITNVSHDIKTPLTSIINYADLIGKEETDNTTIKEYADVLHRQSVKLKRLIDDLIEASKASTGNIELNMEQCDLNVIIPQITGEYEDRLNEIGLSLITKVPDEPVMIMADGRRLWRIFDNLMGNILKYSLPGTRVYITMVRQNGEAIIVFKNTSRDQIDLSPEELTERFVRGDESRNTEGNGLGLSIAKSLVELQGGAMSLYADGDLFKVILRFPLI